MFLPSLSESAEMHIWCQVRFGALIKFIGISHWRIVSSYTQMSLGMTKKTGPEFQSFGIGFCSENWGWTPRYRVEGTDSTAFPLVTSENMDGWHCHVFSLMWNLRFCLVMPLQMHCGISLRLLCVALLQALLLTRLIVQYLLKKSYVSRVRRDIYILYLSLLCWTSTYEGTM
jgi:hypothetical protein